MANGLKDNEDDNHITDGKGDVKGITNARNGQNPSYPTLFCDFCKQHTPQGVMPTAAGMAALEILQGELLALVGVSAGLSASGRLSTCSWTLGTILSSPVVEEQLFGRLFALLAGVDDPFDATTPSSAPPVATTSRYARYCTCTSSSSRVRPPAGCASLSGGNCLPRSDTAAAERASRAHSVSCSFVSPHADESLTPTLSSKANSVNIVNSGKRALDHCEQSDHEDGSHITSALNPNSRSSLRALHSSTRSVLGANGECVRSWRAQLKRDLATSRKPDGPFSFSAQHIGRQDVLMAVVPCNPPVLAVTCTTKLSLFSLDGTALPPVMEPSTSPNDPSVRSGAFGTFCRSDEGRADSIENMGGKVAEAHERDIRCIATSPAGDMVATGSLDHTIRVRSVPGCDWVCRLRGHEANVRCLLFHRPQMLISGDDLGNLAVWSLISPQRRLQTVQAHPYSGQVMVTATREWPTPLLATGGLDGFVRVWSVADDGRIRPLLACSGFGQPYSLAALRGTVVFTSLSGEQSVERYCCSGEDKEAVLRYRPPVNGDDGAASVVSHDVGSDGVGRVYVTVPNKYRYNKGQSPSSQSGLSVVNVATGTCRRVSTGHKLGSNQVGPAGIYLGAIVVSPVEPWAGYSDSEVDEDDELGRVWLDSIPRVFRITKAAPIGAYADTHRVFNKNTAGPGGTDRGRMECIETTHEHHVSWVDLSPTIRASSGWTPPRTTEQSMSRNPSNSGLEDSGSGALCTCSLVVGSTIFVAYDTGGIWAHSHPKGHRLYRLDVGAPVVHLVDAFGYLFAYSSSGKVSRWTWVDRCQSLISSP